MGKLFGTDGIRGVVGENLTADMAFRVGQAVGTVLTADFHCPDGQFYRNAAPNLKVATDNPRREVR